MDRFDDFHAPSCDLPRRGVVVDATHDQIDEVIGRGLARIGTVSEFDRYRNGRSIVEHELGSLAFDVERRDRYDRLLAAVFTPDGTLVNAQVAAAGFADVVVFGANDRFEPDIRAAVERARDAGLGIWASAASC